MSECPNANFIVGNPERYLRSSCRICRSSGRISFDMASSTAAGLPGRAKMGLPRAMPAVARLRRAPLPIWCQLNMRNSSPKPGRGDSRVDSMTAIAWSRRLMPVPPVVRIASKSGRARSSSSTSFESAGIVGDKAMFDDVMAGVAQQVGDPLSAGVGGRVFACR